MPSASLVLFYILGGITLMAAGGVVVTRNVVYGALFLLTSLLGVAGLFVLLYAEFLALVQVLIYGGAIVIVILFALMLTRARERPQALFGKTRPLGVVAALGLLAAFIGASVGTDWFEQTPRGDIEPVPFQELGDVIFTVWIVPFILIGILLSIALDGAVLLAVPDEED